MRRNHRVSIIVRSERNIYFDLNAVEVHTGNFTNYHQLKTASQGCDAIIHIAAVTATNLLHYEDYQRINAVGAGLIVKVSEELKIDKLVFVSTANTVGYGRPNQLADETYPVQPPIHIKSLLMNAINVVWLLFWIWFSIRHQVFVRLHYFTGMQLTVDRRQITHG